MSVLESDVIMGTFTHRNDYVEKLQISVNKFLPHIPFITIINPAPINVNMELLRQKFMKSGKRYFIFLDDDIQFLNSDIIKNALKTLVGGKYACVSVYSTYNPAYLSMPYNPNDGRLIGETITWCTGYFCMIDSWKIGHIIPDVDLPYPNAFVDISYSLEIRKEGFDIGLSHDYLYHLKKDVSHNFDAWNASHEYMKNKYGQEFYYNSITTSKCIIE